MPDQAVIHKQVFRLQAESGDLAQTFEVPPGAELLSIGWDTREPLGIAFWYRFRPARLGHGDPNSWRLVVRGTGDPFPDRARHLATVVRDGFAWHLLDADGYHIRWAAR